VELAEPAVDHLPIAEPTYHGSVPASVQSGTRDREFLFVIPVGYRHAGTEKKFDDTGRLDHIAFAATMLRVYASGCNPGM
jgi:hypothetical protein